jgi:hypothetical protein
VNTEYGAEIARLAEEEGGQGIDRWIAEHGGLFQDDPQAGAALFDATKRDSLGAAYLLARMLTRRQLLPPAFEGGLKRFMPRRPDAFTVIHHLWFAGICHIQMPHVSARVRAALDSGDILCGYHRFYCGGSGPDAVAFTDFAAFEEHIRAARAGDDFMLASVQQLVARNQLLEPTLAVVRDYLVSRKGANEVFMVQPAGPNVEVLWEGSFDPDDEDPRIPSIFASPHPLYAVPFTWEQDFFVDAKKANAEGAIPLGGAY